MRRILVLLSALTGQSAFAQSSSPGATPELLAQCMPVLVADVVRAETSGQEILHVLNIFTKEDHEFLKTGNTTGLSYKNFTFDNDWQKFLEKRQSLFQKENFSKATSFSKAYLSSHVPPVARDRWLDCIKTVIQGSDKVGLHMYTEEGENVPYKIKIRFNSSAGHDLPVIKSFITGGYELLGTMKSRTLFPPKFVIRPVLERTYFITPDDETATITVGFELKNGNKHAVTIPPAENKVAPPKKATPLQANSVSEATSTGVGNLNITTECGQPREDGYLCSSNQQQPARAVYDLKRNHLKLPAGTYDMDIEYSSAGTIPSLSIRANEAYQFVNLPSTGGTGMNTRNTVRTRVVFSGDQADLVVDRGAGFPNLRGFVFTPVEKPAKPVSKR